MREPGVMACGQTDLSTDRNGGAIARDRPHVTITTYSHRQRPAALLVGPLATDR